MVEYGFPCGWHLVRPIHAFFTPDLSSRYAQHIGRLLIVTRMHTHIGYEFLFPIDSDTRLLMVPTRMCVLEPSGNGLYLLPNQPEPPSSPSAESSRDAGPRVALTAQCDPVMWHRWFGHLNMQSMHAKHTHNVSASPTLAGFVNNVFAIHACSTRPLMHPATPLLAQSHPVPC
jgi:hypothetical protein